MTQKYLEYAGTLFRNEASYTRAVLYDSYDDKDLFDEFKREFENDPKSMYQEWYDNNEQQDPEYRCNPEIPYEVFVSVFPDVLEELEPTMTREGAQDLINAYCMDIPDNEDQAIERLMEHKRSEFERPNDYQDKLDELIYGPKG